MDIPGANIALIHAFDGEVFAERAIVEPRAMFGKVREPFGVARSGIGVYGLVRAAMDAQIGLLVAVDIQRSDMD